MGIQDANDPRTIRGGKLEKERIHARSQTKLWIVYLFISTICYMVHKMSNYDPSCKEKGSCDCTETFGHFLALYVIAVVCHTVFRIKYYCRSNARDVKRRELKVSKRGSAMIFASIFIVIYVLMLFGWYRDTERSEC